MLLWGRKIELLGGLFHRLTPPTFLEGLGGYAKAELNCRRQACEVLTDTGIRAARNGLPSRSLGEGWPSTRVPRPLLLLGRKACVSQHLCSEKWNPVLESHQPLRFAGHSIWFARIRPDRRN
jgi:hypothetical protein